MNERMNASTPPISTYMSVYSFLSLFPISFPCPLVVVVMMRVMMRVVVVVVVVSTCMHTWAWSSTRSLPAQHALAHESCTKCIRVHPIAPLPPPDPASPDPCRPPVSSRVVSCVSTHLDRIHIHIHIHSVFLNRPCP